MQKRKFLVSATAFLLVLSMLAGCSTDAPESNTPSGDNNSTVAPANDASAYPERLQELGFTGTAWLEDPSTPIITTPETYTVMGISHATLLGTAEDWAVNTFFTDATASTNIQFDFETVTPNWAEWNEKAPIAFATDDLPDIFLKANFNSGMQTEYGAEGMLLDLKPYIDEYMPNLRAFLDANPHYEQAWTAADGGIYALGSVYEDYTERQAFRINRAWLEELGLPEPTTVDELYDTLYAFTYDDPNGNGQQDEYGIVFQGTSYLYEMINFFGVRGTQYNSSGGTWLYLDDDNEIKWVPEMAEFKDFLNFANRLYEDGIMDPDSFTLTADEVKAKNSSEDAVYGMYNSNHPYGVGLSMNHPDGDINNDEHIRDVDYMYLTPITPDNGREPVSIGGSGDTGRFAISYTCENPEPILVWMDSFYTEEGGERIWGGREGDFGYNEDGAMIWYNPDGTVAGGTQEADVRKLNTLQPGGAFFGMWPEAQATPPVDIACAGIEKIENTGRVAVPSMMFAEDDTDALATIQPDVNTVIQVYIADVITGTKDLDSTYEDFIAECKKIGVDQVVEIYNNRYDELNG